MKKLLLSISFIVFATSTFAQSVTGDWYGALVTGGGKLPVVLHINKNGDTYAVTMDSPTQHAMGMAMDKATIANNSLTIIGPHAAFSYTGKFIPDSDKINGAWIQGGFLKLNLTRNPANGMGTRPQDPKDYPYTREEVTVTNTKANVVLAGTLTMPEGNKASKIVVLITGSGPQNRDEELFDHRPFLVWADWLTRHGIAVLRCDDRGVAKSTGDFSSATTADFASDAGAIVDYISSRADLKSMKIGLMGHSEGGIVAPMAASTDRRIGFVVMLAGPGVPIKQLMIKQTADQFRVNNSPDYLGSVKLNEKIYVYLVQNPTLPKAEIDKGMDAIVDKELSQNQMAMQRTTIKDIQDAYHQQIGKWFRYFIAIDPAIYLAKLQCPVLAIDGTLDMQVSGEENLKAINAILLKNGNKHFETVLIPGLNHLMQKATTGALSEYGAIDETVDPLALQKVADWIGALN